MRERAPAVGVLRRGARYGARLTRLYAAEARFRAASRPLSSLPLADEIGAFCRANARHFTPLPRASTGAPRVVVEGLMALAGPNYALRTGLVARAIFEATGAVPLIVVDDYSHRASAFVAIYRSFGFDEFSFLRGTLDDARDHAFAAAATLAIARRGLSGEELLTLRCDDIPAGDLIYDDAIRGHVARFTIPRVSRGLLPTIHWAHYFAHRYRRLVGEARARHVVVSHTQYIPYGLLARAGFELGADVFETTDTHLTRFKKGRGDEFPVHHNGVRRAVVEELQSGDRASMLTEAEGSLAARFAGAVDHIDVRNAFASKRNYSSDELRDRIGIPASKPIVFLMAHVFTDSPHLAEHMLHRDYHHWLVETLRVAGGVADIHWIVKEHPSAALYGESGEVTRLVAENAGRRGNISACPPDFNTASIRDVAHAVVTVNGTVGIELPCFGVPAVIAGRPFYAGFGFTEEPPTLAAYDARLRSIAGLERLAPAQQEAARLVWRAFERVTSTRDAQVISNDDLRRVWGYGTTKDVAGAFRDVAARLERTDPRAHPAYAKALEYARRG